MLKNQHFKIETYYYIEKKTWKRYKNKSSQNKYFKILIKVLFLYEKIDLFCGIKIKSFAILNKHKKEISDFWLKN